MVIGFSRKFMKPAFFSYTQDGKCQNTAINQNIYIVAMTLG